MRIPLYARHPVPAGISLPIVTFSFNPTKLSLLPLTLTSVRTRVVSWKDAAEIKLSVLSDDLVIPRSTAAP